jgi:hypothetical protein
MDFDAGLLGEVADKEIGLGELGGAGRLPAIERAGAALTARYLASGETALTVDMAGSGLSPVEAAGFLLGLSLSTFAQNRYVPALARTFGRGDIYSNNNNDPEDKDISIMTGILSKLVQQEFNNGDTAINIERIRGSYIPGSGILFTLTQRMPFYSRPMLLGVNGRAAFPSRYGLKLPFGQAADVAVGETTKAANTSRAKARTVEKPLSTTGELQQGFAVAIADGTTLFGDSIALQYNKGGLSTY